MDIQIGNAVAGLNVKCVMSVSRLMFSDNVIALTQTLEKLGIKHTEIVQGAYFGHCMTIGIERCLDADVILTVDHDSVWKAPTVHALLALLLQSGYDAIAPLQCKRLSNAVIVDTGDEDGVIPDEWFEKPVQPVKTAHFGCTVIRTEAIRRMQKPWFLHTPNADGDWSGGHVDADIHFWKALEASGGRLGMATGVSIGHAELQVSWPSLKSGTGKVVQYPQEFWGGRAPSDAHGVIE